MKYKNHLRTFLNTKSIEYRILKISIFETLRKYKLQKIQNTETIKYRNCKIQKIQNTENKSSIQKVRQKAEKKRNNMNTDNSNTDIQNTGGKEEKNTKF